MRFLALLTVLATFALPSLALAQGCYSDQVSQSCAEGTVWDAEARACVAVSS